MKNNRSSKLVESRGTATKNPRASSKVASEKVSSPRSKATATKTKASPKTSSPKSAPAKASSKSRITSNFDALAELPEALSSSERTVLNVFRRYQMTPGQMLCFSGSNLDSHKATLAKLIGKQMLLSEKFRGGYSLTKLGFAAMMAGAPMRD